MLRISVLLLVMTGLAAWGATPETSRLFETCVDAESGVVSYKLKTGLAGENQQSIYFTQQSMTSDGRFLLFNASQNEFTHGPKPNRTKALKFVDFEKDEIGEIPLPPKTGTGYLDCATGEYWFITAEGLYKRVLAVDPAKDVPVVAPLPANLAAEGNIKSYAMHLTLSGDRTKAFLDATLREDGGWVEGVIDIPTKTWTRWNKSDFELVHGQINPVLNDVAICALQFTPPEKKSPLRHWGCSKPGGVCTRIHLVRPGGETHVKIPTHATHEHWAQDGKGFIWCCNNNTVTNGHGVWYRALEGTTPQRIYPGTCTHATLSGDNRYVVFDDVVGKGFRGSGWRVGFYDRTTQRTIFIRSKNEPLTTKDKPSTLHPDPHPQFVCQDRYVVSTMNNADGHMDLLVTPVAPLKKTAACIPATSALFTPRTDPESGVISYELKKGVVGFNQQHPYFNNKAMTDDGRFIVLAYADDEATSSVTNEGQKALAVIDLEKDTVFKLPSLGRFSIPFLDVKTARLYCADRTDESMAMFDLRVDPVQKIRLCDLPREVLALGPVKRWYTHLTLTADRTRAYLDTSVNAQRWIQGLLRLSDGTFEKWGETDFPCGHSQICPVNDRIAYGGRSQPGKHRVPDPQHLGETMLVPIPKEQPYPCMWLMRPGEKPRMIPSRDINHSTHQNWFEDGLGWYWCSRLPGPGRRNYTKWGVYAYDLASDSETKLSDEKALHATITADRSAIVYDWPDPHWRVVYQNFKTKKVVSIHSSMPDYFRIRAKSVLHADPHPQFVCQDRWILSMVIVDGGKRLTIALTPVEQLEKRTK